VPRRTDLPEMPLCNGCGACCGPVTARPDEVKRIRRYVEDNDVVWLAEPIAENTVSFGCGFLRKQDDETLTCAIHPVRPWACRAFGVIKEMACPLFPEAAIISVPRQQATSLHLIDPTDKYLGEHFEPGYLKRIGGRGTGVALQQMAAEALRRKALEAGRRKQGAQPPEQA
jgi:hypothetical protein